jgi:PleD family two-component response regulator
MCAALSSQAGFDHLHDDVFDAVILNAAHEPGTALALCATLRRNSMLHDLPTMALVARGDTETADAAIEKGACAILEAGVRSEAPIGWLLEAVRRDRRRRHVEHDLRALRDRLGDARTGTWRSDAFQAHLTRLAIDHHASGRPLSFVALRVMPAHGANAPPLDVWRRGFSEIATLAGRLSREADSVAALGVDLIVVALPAATLAAAKHASERIASVAECTAFVSGDEGAAPMTLEQSVVELQPGESGGGLMARALRQLDVEDMLA